jgi:hypothetical protein
MQQDAPLLVLQITMAVICGCMLQWSTRTHALQLCSGLVAAVVHENRLLEELPAQLRVRVVRHVLQDVFRGSQLFMVRRFCCP